MNLRDATTRELFDELATRAGVERGGCCSQRTPYTGGYRLRKLYIPDPELHADLLIIRDWDACDSKSDSFSTHA